MPNDLVLAEVTWEEKPGNGWLLDELYDLLLRDRVESSDLTVVENGGRIDSEMPKGGIEG